MDVLEFYKYSMDYLKSSSLGWAAEYVVIIVLIAIAIYIVSFLFYSKPIIKLKNDIASIIKGGATKLNEANESPYDEIFRTNKYISFFIMGYFYSMSLFVFLYSLVFFSIGMEFGVGKDILWYKQLILIGFGFLMIMFSRLMRVQADKELYKLKRK